MKNKYFVGKNMVVIFLTTKDGKHLGTVINKEDLARANEFPNTWYARWNKETQSYYVLGNSEYDVDRKRKTILLHRWLMRIANNSKNNKRTEIDHINHDTLDNRRAQNLREATRSENQQNIENPRSHGTSGHLGVSWYSKTCKWKAQIQVNGKKKHIGYYSEIEDAIEAHAEARRKYMPFSQEAMNAGNEERNWEMIYE